MLSQVNAICDEAYSNCIGKTGADLIYENIHPFGKTHYSGI